MHKLLTLIAVLLISVVATGCPAKDGPMERAGESADRAVEDAGDAIEDATD